MAMPVEQLGLMHGEDDFDSLLIRLQATEAHKEALWGSIPPFDYEAWIAEAGPAGPDELAEMETILAQREIERQRSLEIEEQDQADRAG
jgi:hypothetical protein